MVFIFLYLAVINIYGYILMGSDKNRAIKHLYRISEKKLWMVAILFGAVGMYAGMLSFRHKTKHSSFKYGLPILSLIEIGIVLKFLLV